MQCLIRSSCAVIKLQEHLSNSSHQNKMYGIILSPSGCQTCIHLFVVLKTKGILKNICNKHFFFFTDLPVARNRSVRDRRIRALMALLNFVSLLWMSGVTFSSR